MTARGIFWFFAVMSLWRFCYDYGNVPYRRAYFIVCMKRSVVDRTKKIRLKEAHFFIWSGHIDIQVGLILSTQIRGEKLNR